MNSKTLFTAAIVLIVVALAGGIWLYNWVLGETKAPSSPISAPTLALATQIPTEMPTATGVAAAPAPTTAPTESSPEPTAVPQQPQAAPTQSAVEPQQAPAASPAGPVVYQIVQAESQVRFNIYELLRGSPKDVIGASNQVAGQVAVDPNDLSTAQIGEILINARTLATDDDRRNQAIRNRILFTDQYEFITFKPAQINGLSGSGAPGQSYSFQVAGDLTIRDVTKPVVFDVTLTAESAERLVGTAKSSIQRADFNLVVPNVPFVANVGEAVALEIDFVLAPQ